MIGVLAFQGGFAAHLHAFNLIGVPAKPVRSIAQAEACTAFVLPGGESTTQLLLMQRAGFDVYLKARVQDNTPVWGTCAGAIVLSRHAKGLDTLNLIDLTVERNAYGSQCESHIASIYTVENQRKSLGQGLMIRAPRFTAWGSSVRPLAYTDHAQCVAVVSCRIVCMSFHPELMGEGGWNWHAWFAHAALDDQNVFDGLGTA